MTAITRLYDSYGHAQGVLRDLKSAGISQSQISVVANPSAEGIEEETSNTTTGASVGAAVGGGAGLLAGLGLMAIPGAGPIVAAGWLVATLTGAVAGAASGGGHYRLRLVSARFEGCTRVARHRLVYDCLEDMLDSDIHALAITALTPTESPMIWIKSCNSLLLMMALGRDIRTCGERLTGVYSITEPTIPLLRVKLLSCSWADE